MEFKFHFVPPLYRSSPHPEFSASEPESFCRAGSALSSVCHRWSLFQKRLITNVQTPPASLPIPVSHLVPKRCGKLTPFPFSPAAFAEKLFSEAFAGSAGSLDGPWVSLSSASDLLEDREEIRNRLIEFSSWRTLPEPPVLKERGQQLPAATS